MTTLRSRLLSLRTAISLGATVLIIGVAVWRAPVDWHDVWSAIRHADVIFVVKDAELVEQGTHQQLVALGGRYAELFELQAAGYR